MSLTTVYPTGYYLSNLHVRNVLEDLQDSIYGSSYPKQRGEHKNGKLENYKSSQKETSDEKYSPEHLRSLLNVYKPMYTPAQNGRSRSVRIVDHRPKPEVKKVLEKRQSRYSSPARGIPQTLYDHDLNQRLQNLIAGELQPSTVSSVGYYRRPIPWLLNDYDYYLDSYKPWQDYVYPYNIHGYYPYNIHGYSYPYTKWLMMRRELARAEGEQIREESPIPREVAEKPRMTSAYSEPNLTRSGSEPPAYNFRERPWEYMRLLRQKDYQRSMEVL